MEGPWLEWAATQAVTLSVSLISVIAGARLALWVESRKGQIRLLPNEELYVEHRALRKDRDGWYAPGFGRVSIPDGLLVIAKQRRGRVAYCCKNLTAGDEEMIRYVACVLMPL